jgi:ribosomal protein S17
VIFEMSEIEDSLMGAILTVLSEKVDKKVLCKANTIALKKKLYKTVSNELFYKLLKDNKLELAPGFGTFILKQIREKDKKIYNRSTGEMINRHVKGKKVVYKPGDIIKEFL